VEWLGVGQKEGGRREEGGRVPRLITNMTIFYACGWRVLGTRGVWWDGSGEVGKWGVGVEWSGERGRREKERGGRSRDE